MTLAKLILTCVGDIDEVHIADAEATDVAKLIRRKRAVKYSVAAGLMSVGLAAAVWLIGRKVRGGASTVATMAKAA